jgi:outer membrane protein OmpA-like peptidoglycan-associated protein
MWAGRPGRWLLWAAPVVTLTGLAAVSLNTPALDKDIAARVAAALAASGNGWAKPTFNGRDASLTSDAPSQEAVDAVIEILNNTYGVRTVHSAARVVPASAPVSLLPPTIDSIATNDPTPEITGSWPEGNATTLAISMAGGTFRLGNTPELSSSNGAWVLQTASPLADGIYLVTAEVSVGSETAVASQAPAQIVIDTQAPANPTLQPTRPGENWPFVLSGTWAEGDAIVLTVEFAGKLWTLGSDEALKTDGQGNWSFAPAAELKPGSYDLTLEVEDKLGNAAKTTFAAAVVIPEPGEPGVEIVAATTPPAEQAPPTIKIYSGAQRPASVSGTWDEANATMLRVLIPAVGVTAVLGADASLTSVQGVWTLNLGQALPPGIYNVVAESTDAAGKVAADQTTAEIYVKSPPPAPPLPPYDCAAVLAKIAGIFPIRFDFNQTSLKSPYDLALKQYAALLKDARCASVKAQVAGHSDSFGPRLYNQALSEARAQAVVALLAGDGVDPSRLSIAGFSELAPVDPESSIPARKKNRRVEITLLK